VSGAAKAADGTHHQGPSHGYLGQNATYFHAFHSVSRRFIADGVWTSGCHARVTGWRTRRRQHSALRSSVIGTGHGCLERRKTSTEPTRVSAVWGNAPPSR
jgi:hypothetical protein